MIKLSIYEEDFGRTSDWLAICKRLEVSSSEEALVLNVESVEVSNTHYCEVCDDAWVTVMGNVKDPFFVCSACREQDSTIVKQNSKELDNGMEYGNG